MVKQDHTTLFFPTISIDVSQLLVNGDCSQNPRITRSSQVGLLRSLTPREAQKEKTRHWACSAVAPNLRNKLPPQIRLAPSLGIFKNQLKTWLYRQAFPPGIT